MILPLAISKSKVVGGRLRTAGRSDRCGDEGKKQREVSHWSDSLRHTVELSTGDLSIASINFATATLSAACPVTLPCE